MKYWYFSLLLFIILFFISYQLCKIQKSVSIRRKLFCAYPEIYISILILAFAVYILR